MVRENEEKFEELLTRIQQENQKTHETGGIDMDPEKMVATTIEEAEFLKEELSDDTGPMLKLSYNEHLDSNIERKIGEDAKAEYQKKFEGEIEAFLQTLSTSFYEAEVITELTNQDCSTPNISCNFSSISRDYTLKELAGFLPVLSEFEIFADKDKCAELAENNVIELDFIGSDHSGVSFKDHFKIVLSLMQSYSIPWRVSAYKTEPAGTYPPVIEAGIPHTADKEVLVEHLKDAYRGWPGQHRRDFEYFEFTDRSRGYNWLILHEGTISSVVRKPGVPKLNELPSVSRNFSHGNPVRDVSHVDILAQGV